VGSDCAIGKMTVCCELDLEARRRGLRSVFVPTGQTGIAIAGWGISVDAVVSDFLAGAAEQLVVEGGRRGDLLWIEGQGALLHPLYSGVTLGLMHGSVPHAYVLCHEAGLTELEGVDGHHPIPPLRELVELHERISLPVRPARVVAVAVNTRFLADEEAARAAVAEAEEETGLPADDPVRFGPGRLLDAVLDGLKT
jgi:D-glutamate N-acetyltransferase